MSGRRRCHCRNHRDISAVGADSRAAIFALNGGTGSGGAGGVDGAIDIGHRSQSCRKGHVAACGYGDVNLGGWVSDS